jgi:hypothetical protein
LQNRPRRFNAKPQRRGGAKKKEQLEWFDFNFILILAALRPGVFALNSSLVKKGWCHPA